MRISTAPVNWNNNDLPEWRPIVPFPALLDEMLAAGYESTEYDDSFGGSTEDVLVALHGRGIALAGAYTWLDLSGNGGMASDLPRIQQRLQFLEAIDCRHLIVADALRAHRIAMAGAVPDDGSASLDRAGYGRLCEGLANVVELANRRGIAVHYHNHVGTFIETPGELETLVSDLPDTGADLCFDTGHYAFGGGTPATFVEHHAAGIGYLHLKDVDASVLAHARTHRLGFLEALREYIFCPLGDGIADIPGIVERLANARFDGFLVVEQDTCPGDSTVNARSNLEYLTACIEECSGKVQTL